MAALKRITEVATCKTSDFQIVSCLKPQQTVPLMCDFDHEKQVIVVKNFWVVVAGPSPYLVFKKSIPSDSSQHYACVILMAVFSRVLTSKVS